MNTNKFPKKEFMKFIKDIFEISDIDCDPINIRIKKPDLFIASFLAEQYINVGPDIAEIVTAILRNVGRKVFRLNTPASVRYISRITYNDRLQLPHNDILEILESLRNNVEHPLHEKFHKIRFEPLINEYQKSTFLIHDQCISDGTTTLNLSNMLKPFNIKLIGTDIAVYYYHLMPENLNNIEEACVTKTDNISAIVNRKSNLFCDVNIFKEGAIFDYSGKLKQIKVKGILIYYHPISRKLKMLKKILPNLIKKAQYRGLAEQYMDLFMKMKHSLINDTDIVRDQGYILYRKKFLNPQYKYFPEIIFKEHDVSAPFKEKCSIMLVFNALTFDYFSQGQIDATIPILQKSLKDYGLLFIGEGDSNDISYSVFQKVGETLRFVYDIGTGAGIKDMILHCNE